MHFEKNTMGGFGLADFKTYISLKATGIKIEWCW